ncbi:hypothetical protein ACIBI9_19325 [Nonomuraea sp. NPDC050451]|uniref:hypothetical protein n=1 Tax=Nonomuraea sp. NPDC050451 TaxID=3364364 RepID=UPI0037B81134
MSTMVVGAVPDRCDGVGKLEGLRHQERDARCQIMRPVRGRSPANAWPKIVVTYPFTSAGAKKCAIDLKTAPSGYFCKHIYNPGRWALMTY